MNKRAWLTLLIALNLALAGGLLLWNTKPQAAWAQAGSLAGNYLVVAGEARDQYDAVYMIDMRTRVLHAFYFDLGTKQLKYGDARDLERDFRNN